MKFRLLLLVLVTSVQTVLSQPLQQKIIAAYNAFENDAQLKYGLSSLTALNSETGEVIFTRNGGIGLAPASTLKTVTSATAFNILGKDFKWETTLGYNGTISNNGILKGDLILTGSGDPTLGSDRYSQSKAEVLMEKWITAVKRSGIKRIEGKIIVDDSLFGTQTLPLGWIWQDIGNYYGAGATSASWRENEFGLVFKPSAKPGDAAQFIRAEPKLADIKIINEVTTGNQGSGDNVYAYSSPYSDIVYVRGTYGIDLNKTIKVSIPDPALLLAQELKDNLFRSSVPSSGFATTQRILSSEGMPFTASSKIISTYQSPPLSQVVYWLNQKSLNLYAENLIKTMAVKQGRLASFEDGTTLIKDFWYKKAGIDPNSLGILDGSGLSPENRVTSTAMAKILLSAKKENWFDSYYESFPLYNNMKMKSGSIRNVLCYTGYQKSSSGTPIVFTFIVNNYNGSTSAIKQKMFKVLDTLK